MDPTKVNVSGLVAPKHEHWDPIVPTERNDSGDFSGDLQVFHFLNFFVFMLGSNNIIQEQYYASHVLYFLIAAFKKSTKK